MDTSENRRGTVASSKFCLAKIVCLETIALSTQCRATFALKDVQTRANFGPVCATFVQYLSDIYQCVKYQFSVFSVYLSFIRVCSGISIFPTTVELRWLEH